MPPPAHARRRKVPRWTLLILGAVAAIALSLFATQRIGGLMNPYELGLRTPFTPEQAKAQVVDAAKEIVSVTNLPIVKGKSRVYLDSCNDQGEAPFRGTAVIWYSLAPSLQAAQSDTAAFLQALEKAGWTVRPNEYGGPPMSAEKNGVTADFEVQGTPSQGTAARGITVRGECRDVTTTKKNRPDVGEPISGF